MRFLASTYLVVLLVLAGSVRSRAQSVIEPWTLSGQNCFSQTENLPVGSGYTGPVASCTVEATCTPHLFFSSLLYSYAYSGLACPWHIVYNTAKGAWNQWDTVNAFAQAIDTFNLQIRGTSFAQETCSGIVVPIQFQSDYPGVCDQGPLWDPPPPTPVGGGTPCLTYWGPVDLTVRGIDDPEPDPCS